MIVKVTVTGTLDLDEADAKLLRKASPGEKMDTMRFQAQGLKARVEEVKESKDKH